MTAVFRALSVGVVLLATCGMAVASDAPADKAPVSEKPGASKPETAASAPQDAPQADKTDGGRADKGRQDAAQAEGAKAARKARVLPEPKALPPDLAGECAWTGKRVLTLLARDDVDQANKFLGFYRMFGCREAHLGPTFRCIVESSAETATGDQDKAANGLSARIDRCWAQVD